MAGQADSLKSVLFALFANTAIAIAKGFAAYFTKSGAMLAEAIHSVADAGNQLLLILGLRQTGKAPTDEHPLGFGKSIYFWSFLVAVILFSVGGMFSIYEGIHKLRHPEPLSYPWVAIGVLTFAIIAESISLWGCMREVNKERYGRSIMQWFRQSRSSALIVVFGEDIAALLGLVFALLAVVATFMTGNPLWDALGTISIGVLLIVVAVFVAIEVKDLLIGQSVEPRTLEQMRAFLTSRTEIAQVYNVLTMQFGPDAMVAIKAKMVPTGSEAGMIRAVNHVESDFRAAFPMTAWLFFEPDTED
ncbi:MAG: cation diffusion facilitator family transporter [Xanthomonadales bacterium]|nr:cation diffusion facilitator family transporter [Gammaproteobacteria bacterium]NNJ80016.1 cation diffusion facilitator family transporter [Xanthomonadales bacterium]NNL05886.1 cation diffusion facilitator family transporter [Xanthomonadales bacterium]